MSDNFDAGLVRYIIGYEHGGGIQIPANIFLRKQDVIDKAKELAKKSPTRIIVFRSICYVGRDEISVTLVEIPMEKEDEKSILFF